MKPETQDQPVAQESSLASPLSAPPACSSALAGLIGRMEQAADDEEAHGTSYEHHCYDKGYTAGYAEACRRFAAEARQCLMNSEDHKQK